jgi:lauroyl/myristoyl acyltransferase
VVTGPEAMPIKRRNPSSARRPFLTLEDVKFAVELPILWLVALTVPERRWQSLCYLLEAFKARLRFHDPSSVARTAGKVLGPLCPSFDPRAFALESAAGRSEHHLQILRARSPRGWHTGLELQGAEHLARALAAGNGAVLWVAHFCFNALATKKALCSAGYRIWHLSRPEHGFSKSTLGIALFNGIRVGAEVPHLAGRIIIERDKPMAATLAAQRRLRKNEIVSITAGAWEGSRLAQVDLLGGRLDLAVGAPGLARLAGAALLPVFTVRGSADDTIRVIIEKPLSVPAEGGMDMDGAVQEAARQFGTLLEDYVCRYPAEWRDWKNLKLPA